MERKRPHYAVVGEAIFADQHVLVGPFRSKERAEDIVAELVWRGYHAFLQPLLALDEVEPGIHWSDRDVEVRDE